MNKKYEDSVLMEKD